MIRNLASGFVRQHRLGLRQSLSVIPLARAGNGSWTRSAHGALISTFGHASGINLYISRDDQRPRGAAAWSSSHQIQQQRGIFHLPLLGIITPKVLAALAMKKVVVVAFLQKYGVKGTFDILRAGNDQLGNRLGSAAYPPAARAAVSAGLDALEISVRKLEPADQADMIWKWLKSVDPNILVEGARKYVYTSPAPLAEESKEERAEVEDQVQAINEIAKQFPKVNDKYVIVLIPKDKPAAAFNAGAAETETDNKKH